MVPRDESVPGPGVDSPAGLESPGSPAPSEPRGAWLRDMPFWALSALLHLIVFVLFLSWVQDRPAEGTDRVVEVTARFEPPPRPYDPEAKPDVKRRVKILEQLPAEITYVPQKPQEITPDLPPRGTSLDIISSAELAGKFAHVDLGVGGGPAGAFGPRTGGGGRPAGAPPACEEAVLGALEWLRRHQSPDGSWKARDFTLQCRTPCRNLDPSRHGDGRGFPEHDVGVTGLAVLAFAGYGHTHRDGYFPEFIECVSRAARWLLSTQVRSSDPATDGRFGPADDEQWIYDHAIATMALGELYVMTHDVLLLQRPVEDAVRLCLRAQNEGFGWRYGIRPGSNDTSVTGWMVLALKTARHARLRIAEGEIRRSLEDALAWIRRATAASGKTGYMAPGDEGSRLAKGHPDPYPFSKELSCMTGVGVLCRIFSGESRGSREVRDGVRLLALHPPKWQEPKGRALSTINFYYWYYASYALFQYGGDDWKRWNPAMQKALLESQRKGGEEDGSWDPIDEWGPAGGRVYSTALGAMTLEVYYRYRRLTEGLDFERTASRASAGVTERFAVR